MKPAPVLMLLLPALLAACTTDLTRSIDSRVDAQRDRSQELRQQMLEGRPKVASESRPTVERVEGLWLPFKRQADMTAQASARDAANRRITITRDFRSIQEVAERITLLTGIPVNVAPDALLPLNATTTAAVGATGAQVAGAAGVPGAAQGAVLPGNAAGLQIPSLPPIGSTGAPVGTFNLQAAPLAPSPLVALSYDGPLSGFLDVAGARFGVSWEWSGKAVNIFRYKMSVFTITAQTMSAVMKDLSDTMKSIVQKIT